MVYKIELRNDAYGSIDNEFIVGMALNLDSDIGKQKLEEFRKLIVEDHMDPEKAVQKAFNSEGYGANLINIDKKVSIFY